MKATTVLGIYDDYASFLRTLKEMQRRGVEILSTYTPVPCHEVEEMLEEKKSPIRHFTLVGGLFGFAAGAALTVYCATSWALIVGGKPIVSIPPYLIIAFELTILFAAILSTIGYFVLSPFPHAGGEAAYDPSFSEDKFGLLVASETMKAPELREVMETHGATETRLL
ncbi:MAG: DUF3341 domain-containing protein [Acidobacteriota bacterium]